MAHLCDYFIQAMTEMDSLMKEDKANGLNWTYCNKASKKQKSFPAERAANRRINCVDGVQWGLKYITDLGGGTVASNALSWYMSQDTIVWLNSNAQKNCEKYFDIIRVGNKTVKQLYNQGLLCEGDILGYVNITHTNAYFGGGKSFDTGHANCSGSGEGAIFKRFISTGLTYKNYKVSYILRLKDRTHYRVQSGAYEDYDKYLEQEALLKENGFKCVLKEEDGMYKAQVGYFDSKENAEKLIAKLRELNLPAYLRAMD